MENLEKRIAETNIVWNDNVSDRGERFELFSGSWHFIIDHTTRFSVNYEDQYNGHGKAEYGVRYNLLYSLLETLKTIPDKKIRIVFYYNYNYESNETFDWKYTVNTKEFIKIIKKVLEESSSK